MEGEKVDREVSPPIWKREREEEQPDSPLWVNGELGSPAIKHPPDTRSPEGAAGEKGAGQNPEIHPRKGARLEEGLSCGVGSSSGESANEGEATLGGPPVVRGSARFHLGYESSEEGENNLGGTNMDESMGEEPVPEQDGASVGGQSPDNENGSPGGNCRGNWY